jgi:glycosidase
MKYASDPFWVKLRWILFVLFWVAWLAMLVGAVVIIIYAEKCPSPAPKKWWQKKAVYEVYVKSFKDSDGSGNGDLNGVTSQLDYLKNLGVGSVYLTGFYKSMGDKYAALDVSDHKEVDAAYGTLDDFKALVDGVHEKEMKLIIDFIPKHTSDDDAIELLNFWSDEGVDGFRVGQSFLTYGGGGENLEVLKKMRKALDEKTVEDDDGNGKILMTEMKDANDLLPYYGDIADNAGIGKIAQMPLNFNLAKDDFKNNFAETLRTSIDEYLNSLKVSNSSHWPNFCLGNHDYSRAASKFGEDKVDFMNMLLLMLPGTPFTYYGEEIGMVDGSGAAPDKFRTNMDWVKAEAEEENVHFKAYKMVAELRETQTILFGDIGFIIEENTFVMSRIRKGNPGYLLISNLGDNEASVDISGNKENDEPKINNMAKRGTLDLAIPTDETVEVGATLDLTGITIPAKTTYLMTFVPDFSG